MDNEPFRKTKKFRHHKVPVTTSEIKLKEDFNYNKTQVNSCVPPITLKPNSTENNNISQNSIFMCSHEKINVEFNISSCEMSSTVCIPKHLGKTETIGRKFHKTSDLLNSSQISGNAKESRVTDELPSLDDTLLETIDLSFEESHKVSNVLEKMYVLNGHQNLQFPEEIDTTSDRTLVNNPKTKDYLKSPDIFSSNQEYVEDIGQEDQAWDMSISVAVEDNNKSLKKCSPEKSDKNTPNSHELCGKALSTRVDSVDSLPKNNENTSTFENLLKNMLQNNAYKTISNSSPQHTLVSSPKNTRITVGLFFGLPDSVRRLIKRFKGITTLYDWQVECLNLPAIDRRKNLVYALPTSGGKTLVAEILVLKEILCRGKNVLFVLPYVSIAQEKVRALSPFAVELGFIVEEYAGSKGAYPPQKRRRKRSVYIATIEKALGLVHSLIESNRMQELGLVVVDELHLIGEPKRGASLESMLTKLIYLKDDIQIIGMSATIGNLADIANFLNADIYTQEFRPVELTEFVKVEEELFKVDHTISNDVPLVFHSRLTFQYSQEQKQHDPDQIGALVGEVIPEHSCLVFCPSKKNCENVAALICSALERDTVTHKSEEKKALYRALVAEGNGSVCPILRKTLPFGVAYHHSGLTTAERSLLEEAFLAKTICCICCTSTLAAGVNLPARRVILRSPYIGTQLLSLSKYKQMVGRAGRTGMGDVGESFLLCKPQDAQKVGELLSSNMDTCNSQLQGTGLSCLIISAIDLALTTTIESLMAMCLCSLLSIQATTLKVDMKSEVNNTLKTLIEEGALQANENNLTLTKIGKAAVKANIDMEIAKQLYSDLQEAQDSLVLLSHLHLLYLVTPYSMMDQIRFNQQTFCNAYMELGAKEIQTAKVLGVGEQCIAQLMTGRIIKGNLNQVMHRFYLSLILFDLWNQNSIWKVSNKYIIPRGLVYNFVVSASAFSSSVVRFCEVLDDMWCFKLLLSEMSNHLTHCCSAELLPLMELPAVKIGRAKQLFNAGFKTLNILAKTEPKVLVQAVDHMPRRIAYQIVAAAKLMLLAKAESLQEEAENVLEGLQDNTR